MLSLILNTEVKKVTNVKIYDSYKWYVMLMLIKWCYHLYYTSALYQLVRNTLQQQALNIKKRQKDFERLLKWREIYLCTFGSIPFIAIFLSDRSWWIVSAGHITYKATYDTLLYHSSLIWNTSNVFKNDVLIL